MDIIGKKYWYFLISGIIIIPGIISLFLFGLNLSIDFTGGTRTEFKVPPPVAGQAEFKVDDLRQLYNTSGIEVSSIQTSNQNTYIVKTKPISQGENEKIKKTLSDKFGTVTEVDSETVGATISREILQNALWAILLASALIVLYIAWSFRQVPKPASSLRFGLCAVVALLHDVLVVVGIFSLLGHFLKVEVDSLFVTAILTIIGFSVHDTIVVFDRIRENLKKMIGQEFAKIVNQSIQETLVRSINTSLTVVMVLGALLIFGGVTIKWFVIALLIGVISGTYSSIFNASPLLVVWEERKKRKVTP